MSSDSIVHHNGDYMPEKVQKSPLIPEGSYTVTMVKELNFFDLTGQNSHTKGTSSKAYHAEIQASKLDNKCQIYTIWGATGASNQTKEWRHYESAVAAEKDFVAIIKSKLKKGYREIDVAQRALGSDAAKAIVKSIVLTNTDQIDKSTSQLNKEVQRLVSELFGITNDWVIKTLKCPLGQLTNGQIDKGRGILDQVKLILDRGKINTIELEKLTNEFYAEIPHNLGQGARGKLTQLLLDDKTKIAQKEQDLDDLIDAKTVNAQLVTNNVDDKYRALNCNINYIDKNSKEFIWIQAMMEGTKAPNHHHLGKIILLDVWKISRQNEEKYFLENSERIAKECDTQTIPTILQKYVSERPSLDKDLDRLFKTANTLPLWHGTRASSLVGIIKSGLLIRPSGAVISGSMYGDNIYFGHCSKSINYTNIKSSYWARGQDDAAFMFLNDVTLGNQMIATRSYPFNKDNIKPNHSIWAKGGYSGVINDEFMVCNPAGLEQQYKINYIVKFTCQK